MFCATIAFGHASWSMAMPKRPVVLDKKPPQQKKHHVRNSIFKRGFVFGGYIISEGFMFSIVFIPTNIWCVFFPWRCISQTLPEGEEKTKTRECQKIEKSGELV